MRKAAGLLLLFSAVWGAGPAASQTEDQPPVLKRRDSTPAVEKTKRSGSRDTSRDVVARGVIRQIDKHLITINANDTRIITCNLVSSTEFLKAGGKLNPEELSTGMHVRVEAVPANDGEELNAVVVELETEASKPTDSETATIHSGPEDEDRPILRRGIPKKREKEDSEERDDATPLTPDAKLPEAVPSGSEAKTSPATLLIEQARQSNAAFTAHLPNLICQQLTTRYTRENKLAGWQANDVVSATVTYIRGKEDYSNVKVGNRAVKKGMMEMKGQRSTGEFGSVMASVMDAGDRAEFQFVKDSDLHRIPTKVYDFKVTRDHSDWDVTVGGQAILPGYSGRVWISRDTARVIRIERKADDIPEEFPIDLLEQTIDYDFVLIAGRKVLLPTESENLGCQRGSSFCAKNVIEFRNFQEFRGQVSIEFEK